MTTSTASAAKQPGESAQLHAMVDKEDDDARRWINSLKEATGNEYCADCGEKNTEWASINLGVFLCISCAGIHRRLSVSVSRVRSIRLDSWTHDMVEPLAETGNSRAKQKFEAKVPACWIPPNPQSRHVCKEQWIRAKYERKEFTNDSDVQTLSYTSGFRQGFLFKRKKQPDHSIWQSRWFVLSHEYFSYFKSYQDRNAKGVIPLTHLNVTLNGPGLDEHSNSMLIVYNDNRTKKTRNIFVYAEDGKEIMDWFCAVRTAKIKLLQETFPERPIEMIRKKATRDFSMSGYLFKMPPSQARFQKRFFILDQNALRYYNKPTDPYALGEIVIGTPSDGYYVDDDVPDKLAHQMHVFMLHVPSRSGGGFPLLAEDSESKKAWMDALQTAISECTGSPDASVATVTYEDDEHLYSIAE